MSKISLTYSACFQIVNSNNFIFKDFFIQLHLEMFILLQFQFCALIKGLQCFYVVFLLPLYHFISNPFKYYFIFFCFILSLWSFQHLVYLLYSGQCLFSLAICPMLPLFLRFFPPVFFLSNTSSSLFSPSVSLLFPYFLYFCFAVFLLNDNYPLNYFLIKVNLYVFYGIVLKEI